MEKIFGKKLKRKISFQIPLKRATAFYCLISRAVMFGNCSSQLPHLIEELPQ
jgi:hypothetical protein